MVSGLTKLMGQREYARHRNVRLSAVQRAVASGRITIEKNGKIDPIKADEQWKALTIATKARTKTAVAGASEFMKARTRREIAAADAQEMETRRRKGELVDAETVRKDAFEMARATRNSILGTADRIAALVAAEQNPARCHEIITAELKNALDALASATT